MTRYLISCLAALTTLTTVYGEDIPYSIKLLIDQRAAAIEKIDRKFVKELEKLRAAYMQDGNLEAANLVQKQIDQVKPGLPANSIDEVSSKDISGTSWKHSSGWIITFRPDGKMSKNWGKLTPAWKLKNGKIYCEDTEFTFSKDRKSIFGRGGKKDGEWALVE